MSIICGTDFSEKAARGSTVAAALAAKLHDRLLLAHALPAGGLGARSPEVMNSLFADLNKNLANEAARLAQLGAEVQPHLVVAGPAQAILSKIVPNETRLVVVGSQPRLVSNHRLFGGVAEHLAESSPVPTLVARHARRLLAWTRGDCSLRIVCAYDFTANADAALFYLNELHGIGPCNVLIAQVDDPWEEQKRLAISGPLPLTGNTQEVQTTLERDLRERVNQVFQEIEVRIRVAPGLGRPDVHLVSIAEEDDADLLVTGSHQWPGMDRIFHLSTSRALLRHASLSVLVVPSMRHTVSHSALAFGRGLVPAVFHNLCRDLLTQAGTLRRMGGVPRIIHVIHSRKPRHSGYANVPRSAKPEGSHAEPAGVL